MKAAQLGTAQKSGTTNEVLTRALWIVAFSLLTAAAAQIRIPVPGTPVPMTLQTAVVLAAGLKLGARDGAFSQILYLVLGACGLHVFADHSSGISILVGPTGGFLFGFILAAWTNGTLMQWLPGKGLLKTWISTFLASIMLFIPGLLVLRLFLPTWDAVISAGLTPFIIGDIVKVSLASVGFLATRPSELS